MKKLFKVIVVLIVIFSSFICVKAEKVDFENFEFSSQRIRERGRKVKVRFDCIWDTNKEIVIDSIQYVINDQEGRPEVTSKGKEHHITFDVENWQAGTMKLVIAYKNIDNLSITEVEEFYLTTNSWQEEIDVWKSIALAVVTTFCVGLATFLIIENNKREYQFQKKDQLKK